MVQHQVEILLVDDNPDDITLALHAFTQFKLTTSIHVARDGAEALDYIFCTGDYADRQMDSDPVVIVLDLKLPRIDGLEVLRSVRADARTELLPVVVLSSSREERDIIESYQLGANSYIVKPVDFEEFVETIRTLGTYWLEMNQQPYHPASGSSSS